MSPTRFSDKVYHEITEYLTQKFGMECKVSKKNMLKTKIDNFMHKSGMDDYNEFISFLKKGFRLPKSSSMASYSTRFVRS